MRKLLRNGGRLRSSLPAAGLGAACLLLSFAAAACGGAGKEAAPSAGAGVATPQSLFQPPPAANTGPFGLYTMRPDGSDVRRIYTGDQERNHAHVSPDGTRIVFSEFNQDLNGDGVKNEADLAASDISIVNIDGSGYQPIAHRYGYDLTPVWSPDGRSILYSSDRDNATGVLDLFVYDLGTGRVRNLTKTPTQLEGDPDWVGNKIVFNRLIDGVMTLWIMDEDGKGARQLTRPSFSALSDGPYPFGDFDPKLSPDGRTIAFERHLDNSFRIGGFVVGRWDVMLLDAGSGQVRILVSNGDANSMPTWDHAGDALAYWAFVRQPAGTTQMFSVSASGGAPTPLAVQRADLQPQMPDWYRAGNETRIVFSAKDRKPG
ncbi:MAG: TolB family protein [Dehalococcoidia bacterium]